SVRYDRVEGVRAYERPGGARTHLPQTVGAVVRARDDAVLRGVLRAQVDGPRRDPKDHGPEGGRAVHGTVRGDAGGRARPGGPRRDAARGAGGDPDGRATRGR